MKRFCPQCQSNSTNHIRNGYFVRTGLRTPIQRYRCKLCKKEFSDATFQLRYRQRKRHLNGLVLQQLISSGSLRRAAKVLNINRKTMVRKFEYLAKKSRLEQKRFLKTLSDITEIQFDDMETFEHSKLKPLSITVVVAKGSRIILGAIVSKMPAKGLIAKKARKKYGKRNDERRIKRDFLLNTIRPNLNKDYLLVETDEQPHYPKSIKNAFPQAVHISYRGRRACVVGQGELKAGGYDPLFSLNHTCAMLRYSISRLVRKTWTTTKLHEKLQDHIDIYINYHNQKLLNL
ncbi:MAG: hypothetical protein VX642_15450 [Bdellovibrionota bacterium]|nr:hypothetical protein [Bdellovibrionota bacterium]